MERTKLLTFAVIALLILNIGTLAFLVLSKSNHPRDFGERHHKPKDIVIKKLHFDTNQIAQYEVIIKSHRTQIRMLDDSIMSVKEQLYQLLRNETIDEKLKISLIEKLSSYQKQIDGSHFNHFEAIKKLCKKEQLDDFNDLTAELTQLFSKPKRSGKR